MTVKPVYLLHIWTDGNNELTMSQLETSQLRPMMEWFDYHLIVLGKSATVYCFYDDFEFTNQQLIDMATKFMKGDYIRIDIDLDKCTATKSIGDDKTPHY
jgi:hypothetical protein